DERPVAAVRAPGGAGEPLVVRLVPALGDLHAVAGQVPPVVLPAVLAVLGHGGQQEAEPGRGGGRVLHHQQVAVCGIGQVVQGLRRFQAVLGEVGPVVVDADVAGVHG